MLPVDFPESNTIIAKDQPEYLPLPAYVPKANESPGMTVFCWKLNEDEIHTLLTTGVIWQCVMQFGGALQPQLLTVEKPAWLKK